MLTQLGSHCAPPGFHISSSLPGHSQGDCSIELKLNRLVNRFPSLCYTINSFGENTWKDCWIKKTNQSNQERSLCDDSKGVRADTWRRGVSAAAPGPTGKHWVTPPWAVWFLCSSWADKQQTLVTWPQQTMSTLTLKSCHHPGLGWFLSAQLAPTLGLRSVFLTPRCDLTDNQHRAIFCFGWQCGKPHQWTSLCSCQTPTWG